MAPQPTRITTMSIGIEAIGMDYDKADPPAEEPEVYWSPDSRHLVAMRTAHRRRAHGVSCRILTG